MAASGTNGTGHLPKPERGRPRVLPSNASHVSIQPSGGGELTRERRQAIRILAGLLAALGVFVLVLSVVMAFAMLLANLPEIPRVGRVDMRELQPAVQAAGFLAPVLTLAIGMLLALVLWAGAQILYLLLNLEAGLRVAADREEWILTRIEERRER